jgi:hypothetical protein
MASGEDQSLLLPGTARHESLLSLDGLLPAQRRHGEGGQFDRPGSPLALFGSNTSPLNATYTLTELRQSAIMVKYEYHRHARHHDP